MPDIDFYGGGNIGTILFNEQDAFDAARAVCPTAPVEFIVAPKWPASEPQQ